MEDPQNIPEPVPPKESADLGPEPGETFAMEAGVANSSKGPVDVRATLVPQREPSDYERAAVAAQENVTLRRRSFRHNLFLLLSLVLSAFILTSWILVRLDSPFGMFSTGPQEVVRAQLRALDRGELRPAYDMFSPRYRGQVSFDTWHELFVTHWRMFHADVVRTESPAYEGPGVTLQIYLHGADDKDYRARFTLIQTNGRWWIDDVHWTQEANETDFSRT
jgi:hypothetical protein